MRNKAYKEASDIKKAIRKIKHKDFSGDSGQIVKNSTYNLVTNFVFKFGSIIFSIIIARMLAPELFGLYSLSLSTIVLFQTFSNMGIGTTTVAFISNFLGKNNFKKAKSYLRGLLKYKIYLTAFSSFSLVILAYFLANNFYHKPIFYALLAGAIYIPMNSLSGFLISVFQSDNNFKPQVIKEVIFQFLRFTIVPVSILLLLKTAISKPVIIAIIILVLSFCHFVGFVYLLTKAKKQIKFLKVTAPSLFKEDKTDLKKFMIPLIFTVFSSMFYGYIDTIMLGRYITDISYIGYYGIALSIVGSIGAIINFLPGAILPTFSRVKKKTLNHIFPKVRNFSILIASMASIAVFLLSRYILMLWGNDYAQSILFLKILSIMIVLSSLITVYSVYFTSQKRTKLIAKLLIMSTILNVILNIIFINYGLQFGMMQGVLGACVASICSRLVYLGGLMFAKKRIK